MKTDDTEMNLRRQSNTEKGNSCSLDWRRGREDVMHHIVVSDEIDIWTISFEAYVGVSWWRNELQYRLTLTVQIYNEYKKMT